jgi:hypothetical protein
VRKNATEATMATEQLDRPGAFFDKAAFDELKRNATKRRVLFFKKNSQVTAALAASIILLCGAGLLFAAASREKNITDQQTATVSFDSEARVAAGTDAITKINTLLRSVKAIPSDVARSIEQQVRQPAYDCNQMPCSAPLQHRNYVARSQLRELIAQKTLGDQAQHAVAHR